MSKTYSGFPGVEGDVSCEDCLNQVAAIQAHLDDLVSRLQEGTIDSDTTNAISGSLYRAWLELGRGKNVSMRKARQPVAGDGRNVEQ